MNRKKLSKICAMLLSVSMLFSTLQPVAAYATQSEVEQQVIQALDAENQEPTQTPEAAPTVSPTPLPVTGAALQRQNFGQESKEDIAAAVKKSLETSRANKPASPKAFASAYGMARDLNRTIDPSNLSDWYKYDNYYHPAGTQAAQQAHNTYNGRHPYFYFLETNVYPEWIEDPNNPGNWIEKPPERDVYDNIQDIKTEVLSKEYLQVQHFSQHIFTEGDANNAELTFLGYGSTPYKDFLIYPTTRTDVKSFGFDIDAANIDNHTIYGFGALLNAGIDPSGNLEAYIVYYRLHGRNSGEVYLKKISGIDAAFFHEGAMGVTAEGGYSGYGEYLDALPGVSIGEFYLPEGSTKMRIDLEIEENQVEITQKMYDSAGNLSTTPDFVVTQPLVPTGYQGFGPIVDYSSHGCPSLSYIKFSRILLTVNHSVIFDENAPDATQAIPNRIDDIVPNTTISSLPVPPTRPGYTFMGWYTNKDNSGVKFDVSTPIEQTTILYAYWEKASTPIVSHKVDITEWTNTDVIVDYTAELHDQYTFIEKVSHTKDGSEHFGTAVGGPVFNNKVVFTKNGTLFIEAKSSYPGALIVGTDNVQVSNIDKTAPTISNFPAGGKLSAAELSAIVYGDNGDSGTRGDASQINESTKVAYLYKLDGTLAATIKLDSAENIKAIETVPAGKYKYVVAVRDNAGNYVDSNYKTITTVTPDKPIAPPEGGIEVVVNASKAIITPESTSSIWTNKNVVIGYEVKSDGTGLGFVKESGYISNDFSGNLADPYKGTLTFSSNGTVNLDAATTVGIDADQKQVVVGNIDKASPKFTSALPGGVGSVATSDVFDKVTYVDMGDNGKTDTKSASQIDESKTILVLYDKNDKTAQAITVPKVNGKLDISSVPAGEYGYEIYIQDKAGNAVSTNGKTQDNNNGGTITPPTYPNTGGGTQGPIVINATAPIIVATDSPTDWTNQNVQVQYDVTSKISLEFVKENNNKIPKTGLSATGSLVFTQNAAQTLDAANIAKLNATQKVVLVNRIDKLAPTITINKNVLSDYFQATAPLLQANVAFEDGDTLPNGISNKSGIETNNTALKETRMLYLYRGEETSPTYTMMWKDLAANLALVPAGDYKYVVSVRDIAKNYANSVGGFWDGSAENGSKKPNEFGAGEKTDLVGNVLDNKDRGPEISGNKDVPTLVVGDSSVNITTTEPTKWVPKNSTVTINYEVESSVKLQNVSVDSKAVAISAPRKHQGMISFSQNVVSQKIEANNFAKKSATPKFVNVNNIDVFEPTIVISALGAFSVTTSDKDDPALTGGKGFGGKAASGVDNTTLSLSAQLLNASGVAAGTKFVADGADAVAQLDKQLISGKKYLISATVKDVAGNASAITTQNYTKGSGGGNGGGLNNASLSAVSITDRVGGSSRAFTISGEGPAFKVEVEILDAQGNTTVLPQYRSLTGESITIDFEVKQGQKATISMWYDNGNGDLPSREVVFGAILAETFSANSQTAIANSNYTTFSKTYNAITAIGGTAPYSKLIRLYDANNNFVKTITVAQLRSEAAKMGGAKVKVVVKDSSGKEIWIGSEYAGVGTESASANTISISK